MYQLAVVGNPVEHSLSPLVFDLFAQQFSLNIEYKKILAVDDIAFKNKVDHFFAMGGIAINVTSPFKSQAFNVASQRSSRSSFCRTANFLYKQGDEILANTVDGMGLVDDILVNLRSQIYGKRILIIGSGFVVDSILLDLIAQNPAVISILARNKDRVQKLVNHFAVSIFDQTANYDIVINTTPNSSNNTFFPNTRICLIDGALCYDLSYAKDSIFLQHMRQLNSTMNGYNGLGMLVEQAAIAFMTLFNHKPDTKEVLRQLIFRTGRV